MENKATLSDVPSHFMVLVFIIDMGTSPPQEAHDLTFQATQELPYKALSIPVLQSLYCGQGAPENFRVSACCLLPLSRSELCFILLPDLKIYI